MEVNALRSHEETRVRVRMSEWTTPDAEWKIRLNALIQFIPEHSDVSIIRRAARQFGNFAK
jgi:hypothetical protein